MKEFLLAILLTMAGWLGYSPELVDFGANPRVLLPLQGGTGTGTAPLGGQLLVGTDNNLYSATDLTAGSNVTITTSSGAITIASTGGGGGASAWEFNFTNAITPTTSAMGIFVTASSTFDSTLRGNATSTWPLGDMVIGTTTPHDIIDSALLVIPNSADEHGIIIQGFPSQNEHLFMIRDSDAVILLDIEENGEIETFHTATADNDISFHADTDAAGFGNITALLLSYKSGAIDAEDHETVIAIDIDGSAATQGTIDGLTVRVTAGGGAEVNALEVLPEINPVHQESGTFGNVSFGIVFDDSAGTFTTSTSQFNSAASDIAIFTEDNDIIYIGGSTTFGTISIVLATVSAKDIKAEFAHSASGGFDVFSPSDGTSGFTENGVISFEADALTNWVADPVNGESQFWIRIKRTRNVIATTPIEDLIQIAATTEFLWDLNGNLEVFNATTTGRLVVGNPTFVPDMATGDLVVGRNATITSYFEVGVVTLSTAGYADGDLNVGNDLAVDGTVTLGTDLAVAHGGTGASSLTDGAILLGSGTNAITSLAMTTNGAILIGDGAGDPTTLTAFTSATGQLLHERGGLEFDLNAITTGGLVRGASSGVMTILTVGTDGQVLTAQADSTVAWEASGSGGINNWQVTSTDSVGGPLIGTSIIYTLTSTPSSIYINDDLEVGGNSTTTGTANFGTDGSGDILMNFYDTNVLTYIMGLDDNTNLFGIASSSGFAINDLFTLDTSGNATVTGGFVIGTTDPITDLIAGDLLVGANTTITSNFAFLGELMPDGLECNDGQILKRTGANNWDCAADAGGGGDPNLIATSTDQIGGALDSTGPFVTPSSTSSLYLPLDLEIDGDITEGDIVATFGAIDIGVSNYTTGGLFRIDVDGSALNAAGSLNFGATDLDAGLYFDGSNLLIETQTASGIIIDSEDDTLEFFGSGVIQWLSDLDGIDLITGNTYLINNTTVLSNDTLGTGVLTSSLTTVGALNSGSIATGFGNIDNGTSIIRSGGIWTIDVDGTDIAAAGSLNFGAAANDAAIYWDAVNFSIDTTNGLVVQAGDDSDLFKIDSSGNASTTGFISIGKTLDDLVLSTGDLYIGNNATTVGDFVVGSDTNTATTTTIFGNSNSTQGWCGVFEDTDGGLTFCTTLDGTLTCNTVDCR